MSDKPKTHTAAFRLFHFRYEMMIPRMFFYHQNYLDKVGYHVTGDSILDQEMLTVPQRVMQTPAALAIFHSQGCPIEIVNPKDSVTIYDDIREHLVDWERKVIQGCHPDDVPPLEELRMLETVAMEFYRLAKHYDPVETTGDELRDRLMDLNRRRNPGRVEKLMRTRLYNEQGDLKPYVSIVDRIEKELFRGYH